MMPCVSGLGTRLALAFVLSAARPLLTSQPVGGGWFGGVGRILSAQRQLPLQIGDLFFGIRDLLIAFGYLTPEILQLSLQPLILPLQVFPTGLVGLPMALRRCPWLPCATSQSRTHPTYSKQFAAICPAPPLDPRDCRLGGRKSSTITFTILGSTSGDGPMPMIPFMERFPELGVRETRLPPPASRIFRMGNMDSWSCIAMSPAATAGG